MISREHSIQVREGFSLAHLEPQPDLVVLGNALSRSNPEVEAALAQRILYISMAELLKEFFIRGRTSLVGTGNMEKPLQLHYRLDFANAGMNPGFLIGGIAENLKTSCADGSGDFFITEGDEYTHSLF